MRSRSCARSASTSARPTASSRWARASRTATSSRARPGCGKTLLARAVAGESNAAFVSVAGTEFVQRYAGEGAARVRDLFAEARSIAPAIVFIDEIDAVGAERGSGSDDGERHQTLNQILVELDGFSQRAGIVVIAATNRPDTLDPALVRPGRFDRHVLIDLPDLAARRAILAVHAAGKPLADDVNIEAVARLTQGMGGADLANVMNEAALLAARRRSPAITMAYLDEAIERAALGVGAGRAMTDEDRRLVAYHEAGHGLVAMALPGARILHRITIIPRTRALGAAWVLDAGDRVTSTQSLLMERMAMMLGGRAAEQVVFGELGDAAGSDLMAVTELAHRMVGELGMSDAVGPLSYGERHGARNPVGRDGAGDRRRGPQDRRGGVGDGDRRRDPLARGARPDRRGADRARDADARGGRGDRRAARARRAAVSGPLSARHRNSEHRREQSPTGLPNLLGSRCT